MGNTRGYPSLYPPGLEPSPKWGWVTKNLNTMATRIKEIENEMEGLRLDLMGMDREDPMRENVLEKLSMLQDELDLIMNDVEASLEV